MTALRCGDALFEPVVRPKGKGFEVELDGRTWEVALREERPGVFLLEGDGTRAVRFHLARDGTKVHLSWDGTVYELEEVREGRAARRHDSGALEAPMPGRVAAVRVEAGSPVTKGQELLVVEAMKMENALRAPRDGVVQAVHVAVGDMVAPGRPLVELEAEE